MNKSESIKKNKVTGLVISFFISLVVNANSSLTDDVFYNVKDFGAKGNGQTLDTKSINNTITVASAAGGGTIYFPAGNYLTGSIRLKNNITLYIDQGAVIIAAPVSDSAGYDMPETAINDAYQDYGHSYFHNSLIWGENLHDVSIIGSGKIWGKDLTRHGHKGNKAPNKSIALLLCKGVTIKDITIYHGGWFCILVTGIDDLSIDNVKIDTQRDGIDIDCCQNVHVSNCSVNCPGDDAICLKSSYALGYARPTKNVTITNCEVSGYNEGTFLDGTYQRGNPESASGRIKFGTESNGGFQNVTISNCVLDYCSGFALETVDGALLEDVTISNITMIDVYSSPLFIRLGARMRAPDSLAIGQCRRILISNMNVYNALVDSSAAIISGLPDHDIEDVELNNVHIYYRGGGTKRMAEVKVPEFEKANPDPSNFGTIPAYGFFIRHVKNLKMSDVTMSFMNDDYRPAIILDEVQGARFHSVTAQRMQEVPFFVLDKVNDFAVEDCKGLKNVQLKQMDHQIIK